MVAGLDGKFQKDASYAAILSWEKVLSGVKETLGRKIGEGKRGKSKGKLKQLEKLKTLKKGGTYEPKALTPTEIKLAAACDRFAEIAPEDDGVVNIKFKSAQIYYLKNNFDEAAVRFGEIIDKWPQHKYGRFAAQLIVESYNVREDWSQLNVWSRKFATNPRLMADKSFSKTIKEFIEFSSFKEIIKVFEPSKTQEEIAGHYIGFATEFPKSKYAMIAVYNAVINYDKANRLEDAIAQANKILVDFKSFKLKKEDIANSKKTGEGITLPETIREKTMYLAATFHGRLAEFQEAADLYESYSKEFKKADKREDAIYNSAIYREGLGDYDKAIANFKQYMKEFPKKDDIPVIDWKIGEIYVKKGDQKSAQSHFSGLIRSAAKRGDAERSVCAEYKVMEAQIAQGRERDTQRSWDRILKSFAKLSDEDKAKPCPLKAAAYITFSKLEPEYEKYLAIDFTNERTIGKDVPAKKDLQGKLEGAYLEVIKLQQPDYAIAALFRLAKLQQNMAKAFQNSPCPKALTEDQCIEYEGMVLEQSYPYEENAIAGYDKALAKAYELQLYNEWLIKAQEGLKAYEPGKFPEIRKYALIPSESAQQTPKVAEAMK
jgi:TolA-binding protein